MFKDGYRSPCYGCEVRQVGCHSTCTIYASYRAEIDAENEERLKEGELNQVLGKLDYKRTQDFRKGLKGRRKR